MDVELSPNIVAPGQMRSSRLELQGCHDADRHCQLSDRTTCQAVLTRYPTSPFGIGLPNVDNRAEQKWG